jgi:hypothetical protein
VRCALLCALILAALASSPSSVWAEDAESRQVIASETRNRVFDYHYNSDYLFGATRGIAGSEMHLAAKIPLYLLAFPTDVALFPFEVIAGRNSDFLFGLTHLVAGSDLQPAAKIPLYFLASPTDIALFPFEAIAGRHSDYLFGVTRGVAGSDMHLAAKIPLYPLTFPVDVVLIPWAVIAAFAD